MSCEALIRIALSDFPPPIAGRVRHVINIAIPLMGRTNQASTTNPIILACISDIFLLLLDLVYCEGFKICIMHREYLFEDDASISCLCRNG